MLTLSIRQPWVWAILHGGKDIENRNWATKIRGKILIHAGKAFDKDDCDFVERTSGLTVPNDLPLGGIVGSVEIVDCVKASNSKWFFGEYGFVLKNTVELPFMPINGRLGFFDVDYYCWSGNIDK